MRKAKAKEFLARIRNEEMWEAMKKLHMLLKPYAVVTGMLQMIVLHEY